MKVVDILTGKSLSIYSCVFHKISSIHPLLRVTSLYVKFLNSSFNVCVRCYWRRGSQLSAMELMGVLSGDQNVYLIVIIPFIFQSLFQNEKGA
jgi:hypothetical protein